MLTDFENLPVHSIIFLHSCGHNPTGADPTQDEWIQITEMIRKKGHFPYFNVAFQGLASGDPERDAFPLRHILEQGEEFFLLYIFNIIISR